MKGETKNSANYTQTLHSTLHLIDFPRVTKCIVYAANYTQTIHKPYIATKETKRLKDKETKSWGVNGQRSMVNGQWSTVKETKRLRD